MAAYKLPFTAAVLLLAIGTAAAITDEDILNFALNLECLEGEFYSWAAYGHGLDSTLRGGGPGSVGGKKAKLSPAAQAYAESIAQDEVGHVKFLRDALGKKAVKCPKVDIGPAFEKAAELAFGVKKSLSPVFNPYADDLLFYLGAFIFEDVGVSAYHGAIPAIKNKAYLTAASGIEAIEAYHGGAIRALLLPFANAKTPYGVTVAQVVQAISNLRDAASGSTMLDQGLFDETVSTSHKTYKQTPILAPGDSNYVAFSRTPAQVLNVVLLGNAKVKKGGFFPEGLNGNIR